MNRSPETLHHLQRFSEPAHRSASPSPVRCPRPRYHQHSLQAHSHSPRTSRRGILNMFQLVHSPETRSRRGAQECMATSSALCAWEYSFLPQSSLRRQLSLFNCVLGVPEEPYSGLAIVSIRITNKLEQNKPLMAKPSQHVPTGRRSAYTRQVR